jgi:hypothetical protein
MEFGELESRQFYGAVEAHQPREIDRCIGIKDLPGLELEVGAKPLGDLVVGTGVDLHAHDVAFAPVVQLFGDAFEHGAALFFLHVQIAVARDAKGDAIEDVVAAKHRSDVRQDKVVEQKKVVATVGLVGSGWKRNQRRQCARNRDDTEDLLRSALHLPLVTKQQSKAQRLVEDAGEGVRGVDGDRRQQGIDLLMEELRGVGPVGLAHLLPGHQPDACLGQRGNQARLPACSLRGCKVVKLTLQAVEALIRRIAALVRFLWKAKRLFQPLQHAGDTDLYELIEIAGRDGEKLHALQKGVGGVGGLFEDALVEEHPALIAIDKAAAVCVGGRCFRAFCNRLRCGHRRDRGSRGCFCCGLRADAFLLSGHT